MAHILTYELKINHMFGTNASYKQKTNLITTSITNVIVVGIFLF